MRDPVRIVEEFEARKRARSKLLQYMQEAKDHVNGDVVIPLPQIGMNEKPIVANIIQQGLDHTAMRVASVLPHVHYPAMNPGRNSGPGSDDYARRRRMANAHWWEQSRLNIKARRMARWLIGFGQFPIYVTPNFDKGIPEYQLRHPMDTYPDLSEDWDDCAPKSVVFTYRQSWGWFKSRYPEAAERIFKDKQPHPGAVVELLHWCDGDDIVLVLKRVDTAGVSGIELSSSAVYDVGEIVSVMSNRAERCLGVTAQRITFDRLTGQYNQLFGANLAQNALMSLELLAVKKGVFPDLALVSNVPNQTPVLVGGEWKDGMSGDINVIKNGDIKPIQLNPGFLTQPTIDRLERYQRVGGSVPSQFGGESPTNIATGRLSGQLMTESVDFPIQEYQEVMADSLHEANLAAIDVARGWFGDEERKFYVHFNKNIGSGEYVPNKHFETSEHRVVYSAPGTDVNSLVIGNGQRVGIGGMSVETMMEQDPMIPDPQIEKRRVVSERLQNSLLNFVAAQVEQGLLDPQDVLAIWEAVESGDSVPEAFKKAQEAAQQRQAQAQAAAQAQAQAGVPSPEAQPGLGPPPDAAEAGAAIGPPQPSQQNLANLLGVLRQPRAITAPMAGQQADRRPVG